jgi:hypothetical protein
VVKGTIAGESRGALFDPVTDLFTTDRASEPALTDAQLRALAAIPGQELTYTCAPPGTGLRTALDRDEDGFFDTDEIDAGSDPADPNSIPGSDTPTPTFTPTATPGGTSTATFTPTFTPTGTPGGTSTATFTPTGTPGGTSTATFTPTPVATAAPCTSGILIDKPRLKVSRNNNPVGDERISISGEFVVTNHIPPINPIANGFTFDILRSTNDELLVTRFVPPGASPGGTAPGWKVNGAGTKWTFKDRKNTLGLGVQRVSIKNRSNKTPGLYVVRVKGKNANFRVATANVDLVITLGGAAQKVANQCAVRDFNTFSGPPPKCEFKGNSNDLLKCR